MCYTFTPVIAKAGVVGYYTTIMIQYLAGVAGEFKQIRWLSSKKAFVLTIITIVFTFIAGFALGAADNLFATILKNIIIDIPAETAISEGATSEISIDTDEETSGTDSIPLNSITNDIPVNDTTGDDAVAPDSI